jgi:hypothetical protein
MLLIASEIGHAFGRHAAEEANVTTLEAAILGLLALMISFTFSMGLTRFDERRVAVLNEVLNEANAIGTAALRARLLPAPQNVESLKLFSQYVAIRLAITQRVPSHSEMSTARARTRFKMRFGCRPSWLWRKIAAWCSLVFISRP